MATSQLQPTTVAQPSLARLINSVRVEAYLLNYIGQWLDAIDLSRGASACRSLRKAFLCEKLWEALCTDNGIKAEGRTRTRNFRLWREIYVMNSCAECRFPGLVIFHEPDIARSTRKRISLCGDCVQTVRELQSVTARANAGVLPNLKKRRGQAFWLGFLGIIPTDKMIKKNKQVKDGIDSPFYNDKLIKRAKASGRR